MHVQHTGWRQLRRLVSALVIVAAFAPTLLAQTRITSPKEHFGFNMGDDYRLANYTQFVEYWKKIDAESDRMIVEEMGKTAEGRPQLMAIVTSPENHRNLAKYKDIAQKLARAEISNEEAQRLAAEGKAVVWIDGGLHATEVLGAAQLIETSYQMVSRTDPETMRFLDDVIILFVHANPDGMELVSNWYMREPDEKKRSTGGIPRLYQKYIGHDNNRDFYMGAQAETQNMLRIQYHEWFPQIVYNHHQTGPAGAVLFAPPFRAPHNHNFDPLVIYGVDLVGTSMHTRYAFEGKPGAVRRDQAGYQTWWNGGLRTTVYFHNMIGLLTETIGNPTPMQIPFTPEKLIPQENYVFPITPQTWHFRSSVDYSVTGNRAVFDVASRHREQFLYNIYKMGRNAIEKGSKDTWTDYPRRIAAVMSQIQRDRAQQAEGNQRLAEMGGFSGTQPAKYFEELRKPELRDPRGFIIPSTQTDFLTATHFVNALRKNGVDVHRATQAFNVAGKSYPAGSYVVKTAQAFRAHVMDMFEPQDYPNDLQYPGGPPKAPYDNAGYTLAFQMGVQFDRILDAFDCPCEKIQGMAEVPNGSVAGAGAGYLLSHQQNDAFRAVNAVLKNGGEVLWARTSFQANGKTYPAGTFYLTGRGATRAALQKMAQDHGLSFEGAGRPNVELIRLQPTRVALWDNYGGSMPSGWTRWIFEQYGFDFDVVYPAELDAGNLNSKYDVIVFVDGGIPEGDGQSGGGGGGGFGGGQPSPEAVPAEYRERLGRVTVAKTVPQLKEFLENGGTVITIGGSTALAHHLKLPVGNHLVERLQNGTERPLPREKLFIPGSVLQATVDNTHPLAHGLPAKLDVFFDNSPVFRLEPNAALKGVKPIAWFDSDKPLRSGWAWGQGYLKDGVAAAEAKVGNGYLFLLGPEVTNRAQPHGTFKFLFNGIYYGPAMGKNGKPQIRANN
ncbi:MAG TPA: M14 metallopeptidase family protein [Gemmatimonadaceae bacterium]|nr:M14 metallopeptidase family protein [Gemmatimonadaceae bacterium]